MFWKPGLLEFLMRLRATMFTLRLDRAVQAVCAFSSFRYRVRGGIRLPCAASRSAYRPAPHHSKQQFHQPCAEHPTECHKEAPHKPNKQCVGSHIWEHRMVS
jgi:hypothetical protein